MADGFYGPGDLTTSQQGEALTATGRSSPLNLGKLPEKYIELIASGGFDGTVDFQVTFDNPLTATASKRWVDVPYISLSAVTNAPAIGAFTPPTSRTIYKVLGHGRSLSINLASVTTGTLTWRAIAVENSGGLSQNFSALAPDPGTAATTSISGGAATANGTAITLNGARSTGAMQVVKTGTVSDGVVTLEASIDGTNYAPLTTWTGAAGTDKAIVPSAGVPFIKLRARISTAITSGGTVTVSIVAV